VDFDSLGRVAQFEFQIGRSRLAQSDRDFGDRHAEAALLNRDGVVARLQKRK